MRFRIISENGISEQDIPIRRLFIIGYAGRDAAAQEKHIRELEEQFGIPAPTHTPMIYECDPCLLVQKDRQFFIGSKTSGEAECVLIFRDRSVFVGVGSDHTDRELEVSSVPKSKQVCPKPVSRELWDYAEVRDHWDSLQLLSWQRGAGEEYPYQNGGLAELIPAERVMDELRERTDRACDRPHTRRRAFPLRAARSRSEPQHFLRVYRGCVRDRLGEL